MSSRQNNPTPQGVSPLRARPSVDFTVHSNKIIAWNAVNSGSSTHYSQVPHVASFRVLENTVNMNNESPRRAPTISRKDSVSSYDSFFSREDAEVWPTPLHMQRRMSQDEYSEPARTPTSQRFYATHELTSPQNHSELEGIDEEDSEESESECQSHATYSRSESVASYSSFNNGEYSSTGYSTPTRYATPELPPMSRYPSPSVRSDSREATPEQRVAEDTGSAEIRRSTRFKKPSVKAIEVARASAMSSPSASKKAAGRPSGRK